MNKILSAVIGGFLGVTMATAVGVGMAVGSKAEYKEADAAETVVYTLDGSITGGTNGYATESEITQNDITWGVVGNTMMNPWRIGGKELTNTIRSAYSQGSIATNITKVILTTGSASNITVNSMSLIVSSDKDGGGTVISTVSQSFSGNSSITFNRPSNKDWTNRYFKFSFDVTVKGTSNRYFEFVRADFYAEQAITTYEYTDTITRQTTGLPLGTGSYQDWSGKKLTSAAIYAGNSSAGNNAIQLRTTNKLSGVVSTASGGTVKSIELNFSTATTVGRKVNIYGNNSAYTAASELHSSDTRGTSIATVEYVEGTTKYTVTPTSSYAYLGFKSSNNALWLDSIVITWETTTEVAAPTSLTVTSNPDTTTFGVGEQLNLKGLVVKDNNNVETINYSTSPAEAYTFVQTDIGNNKTVTVTSLADSHVTTTFTINVVAAFPVSIKKTVPIAWDNNMTLAGGTARFKATLTDGSEVTNIKIGDSGTALIIDNVAVDTTVLANTYSGQWAKLTYTLNSRTAESAAFRIVIEDELLVDHFDDVPHYVLSGESATVKAHYTSFIGKPNVEVDALEPSNLSVSFNENNVTYDSETDVGEIPFTVTGGSTAGQYTIKVTISLNGEEASNTCSIIVRTTAPGHEGNGDYELINSLSDVTDGKYVIAANVDGTYLSMDNVLPSNKKFAAEEITVSNNIITSASTDYDVFDLVRTGDSITIQCEDSHKYVGYSGDGTNMSFELDTSYDWTVSLSSSGVGTFRLLASTTASASTVRALGYHAPKGDAANNVFGPYSITNYKTTAKSATYEYYEIELFKFTGDPEEDTGATEFNMINDFVAAYMHMDDIATTTLDNGNACMGANGLYATAKAGWNTMMSSYTGSYTASQIKGIFQNQFPDAYERYVTWAAKNGDADPFDGNAFVPANSQPTRVIDVNNNAMPAIIITISFVTVSTIAGYHLLKKKKQK